MLIVNLEQYSDFDMPVTVSTWVSDEYNSLAETGLQSAAFQNDRDVKSAEEQLRRFGFKKAKVGTLTIGGNL